MRLANSNEKNTTRDTSDLMAKAMAAYRRRCARECAIHWQPARSLSGVDPDGVIRLRNCNGLLAEYAVTPTGRVRAVLNGQGGTTSTGDGQRATTTEV